MKSANTYKSAYGDKALHQASIEGRFDADVRLLNSARTTHGCLDVGLFPSSYCCSSEKEGDFYLFFKYNNNALMCDA